MRKLLTLAACGVLALGAAACGDDDNSDSGSGGGGGGGGNLSGTIKIDGSSTVAPFAQAAQEAFQAENPDVKITVGTSGTGGGFEKFCNGETDISDASRPIKEDEEVPLCKKGGVKYHEVQVANDGIAVVTNKNLSVDCLTVDQLKKLWNKGSKVKSLKEIDPSLPDTQLELLTALVERRNRIVTREELYREVWGEPYRKSDRSVDVYVGKLRQKLEQALPRRRFIHTHFGFGYRFSPEPAAD